MLSHILQSYQPYLPFIVICAIALTIVALFLVFMAGRRLMARSARRVALAPPPGIDAYDRASGVSKKHFWSGWFKKSPASQEKPAQKETSGDKSFRKTFDLFRQQFSDSESKYEHPWYLLIGPEKSGKSSLLQDLDLELPLGKPDKPDFESSDLTWWYFERGIVLDVRGHFILQKNAQESQDSDWENLLKNLNKARPKCPLNGVILAISAEELIGPHRLGFDQLKDRAQIIYGKLWKMQRILGMKIPVYVVITKTDQVPGFQSFASEIPLLNTQEMFGWSCPYTLDTGFSTAWIHEIFSFLHHSLAKIRLGIFAHGKVDSERDGTMIFPVEFQNFKENLGTYLAHLFKESSYHDSFFLRGVYFTGKASLEDVSPFSINPLMEKNFPSFEIAPHLKTPRDKVIFIRDLFEKKIFREANLAKPIVKLLNHQRKMIQRTKWAAASVAGLWGLGIYYNYQNIQDESRHLAPVLKTVHRGLKGITERGIKLDDPTLLGYLNQEAERILRAFASINSLNTLALFMPTSWFNSMDRYIQDSFTAAYDRIILPALYAGLSHKGQSFANLKNTSVTSMSGGFINPIQSPAFGHLKHYIHALYEFESHVRRYNKLDKTQSIEDLGALVSYLFHLQLPSQFFNDTAYYRTALSKTLERHLDLSVYKIPTGQKLGHLFKAFLDEAFDLKESYPALVILQKNLRAFSDVTHARNLDDRDVRQTLDAAIAVADMVTSGNMAWIDSGTFNPGDDYQILLSLIYDMKLLGPDISQELMRVADHDFVRFKLFLSDLKSSITGPFFMFQEGHLLTQPTQGLVTLIDGLSALLDEVFMAPMDRYELTLKVPGGKLLFWDDVPLLKAGDMVDAYGQFTTQKLTGWPNHLQPIFKVIARHTVRSKITSLIAQAQTFHDKPSLFDGFNNREVTHSQVTNIANVTPHFSKILGIFQDEGFVDSNAKIREILVDQNYDILERIEKLLNQDSPYNAENESLISRWNGEELLGLALFGVHSLSEMKSYLNGQRNSIGFLAKELAEPILTIISLGYEGPYNKPKGLPLVDKWIQIIKDLQGYDTQTVTNSVKILEEFLAYKLNEISVEESCRLDDLEIEGLGETNYFLGIRDRFYTMLKSRCELLMGYKSIERFNQAALFFNKHLGSKYPFTPTAESPEGFEADPEDVQTFFDLYDALTDQDRQLLTKASQTMGAPKSVGDFIHQVDSVRPLLLASLDRGMKKQIPGIKIDVAFRTDRNREIGGNKIIDWAFDFGDHRIDGKDSDSLGLWQAGSPIDVSLRWANDADTVPIPDPRHIHLSVSGPQATFSYRGRWSLIRLIRTHATPDSTFDVTKDARPQTLEFYVPTAFSPACYQGQPPRLMDRKSEPARVYCQLSLNLSEKVDQDSAGHNKKKSKQTLVVQSKVERRLPVPRFPVEAPLVDALDINLLKAPKLRRLP